MVSFRSSTSFSGLLLLLFLTVTIFNTNAIDLAKRHTSQVSTHKMLSQKQQVNALSHKNKISGMRQKETPPKEGSAADVDPKDPNAKVVSTSAADVPVALLKQTSDDREGELEAINNILTEPQKHSASKMRSLIKERKQMSKEILSGRPDPSTDIKFAQSVDGVDRIGSGFDASDGTLKLPTLIWKAYDGEECAPGKTGRWCNSATKDNSFFQRRLPAAIAVTKETEAHSSIARRVYTDTKDLASHEAEEMSFRSPVGVMTQEQDVSMLRDVQSHSDLMLARREQKLYTLKLYPFEKNSVDTASVNSDLLDAFLSTDSEKEDESSHGTSAIIPDCILHDCMIRDERDDIPSTGCLFQGMKVSVPSCEDLNKKEQITLKEGCKSKFFLSMPKNLLSKAYSSSDITQCKTDEEIKKAKSAGPSDAACTAYGADLGNICNANDMKRLGQFVSRWGTHFVESASFGGEMEVSVQIRKDRGSHVVNDVTTRTATDHGRRGVVDSATDSELLSDEANSAAILEPQESSIRAAEYTKEDELKSSTTTTSATTNSGINSVLDAMFASGVEMGQDIRRARLSTNGIENIAISFIGGTSMPATESSVTRSEISKWSSSISSSPALLRRSMSLRPLFELIDHPSVHAALVRKAKVQKDGITEEKDDKIINKNIKKSKKILSRKKLLLENHLRWYMAKSEALGTSMDLASEARTKSEHQLRIMSRTVQDWVDAVVHEDTSIKHNNVDSAMRESSSGLRGIITAARSDQVRSTLEEEKSQEMLTYVMQYRSAASKFEKYCKVKCEKETDAVLIKNTMYGRVRMSSSRSDGLGGGKTAVPSGMSGDTTKKDITDSKFTLKRVKDRCLADCANQKAISVHTSRSLRAAEEIENHNVDGVGTVYDLSTEAFFAGVQGVCTICNGMIRNVVSGSLPMLGGGAAEPRDMCRNHLFAASNEDLANPMTSEYNLDDDMNNVNSNPNEDVDDGSSENDRAGGGDVLNDNTVRRHGSTICLGVVNELEDRMRSALQEHGFATMSRARLMDLVRTWKSHSNNITPEKMGISICKRFVQCSIDELTGGLDAEAADKNLVKAKRAKSMAQFTLARLEKQITTIDENIKKLPKDQQLTLKERKTMLTAKVKEEKEGVKEVEKAEKLAIENHKIVENEETEAQNFCHFDCLAATKWGKEYEKHHKNELSAMSSRRPRDDVIANRASRPCGIQIKEKKEKKCSRCDNRDCMAEARYKCFTKGSVTRCDSRWMVLDGEYYDSLMSYTINSRL